MILVDTSVWIGFLAGSAAVRSLALVLEAEEVMTHPFVLGELTLGHLGPRAARILEDAILLPAAPIVAHDEVIDFVGRHRLAGAGVGWVDAHLLASSRVAGVRLWTSDRRLRAVAARLKVEYDG